jgi:hypothetical protein
LVVVAGADAFSFTYRRVAITEVELFRKKRLTFSRCAIKAYVNFMFERIFDPEKQRGQEKRVRTSGGMLPILEFDFQRIVPK